ncbi:MAG TPA: hypothetical protein VKZ50_03585 [bacterium]|nr:hypothetical protein [bacterium]
MRACQLRSTTGAIPVTNRKAASQKRDRSGAGVARRPRFGESLVLLRALGLSPAAVDRDRHLAARKWSYELLGTMVEYPAGDGIPTVVVMSGGAAA